MRVSGSLNGTDFNGSAMLVAGGGRCVGVSKAALKTAEVSVGHDVALLLARVAAG